MSTFVSTDSVVRKIWGRADVVLFIFAGSAAEFALNKAVDWLYFTGKLPADPLERLFSTVAYARRIIFADLDEAHRAIDQITAIHQGVEQNRGAKIPDWAYRDVLFMLIDYSIRSFELLDHKLTDAEKQEVFNVFYRVGARMQLEGLPQTYQEWLEMRQSHLDNDLICSDFTVDLYRQYRKHLGGLRYFVMKQVQQMLLAPRVRQLLGMSRRAILQPVLLVYRLFRSLRWERPFKNALLPQKYKAQILALDAA